MTKKQRKRGKEHYKKGDRYNARTSEFLEEELKLKCENKLLRAKSLMLQKEIYILQKLQGMKIQQRKRKTKRKKLESIIIIKLHCQANRKRNRKTTIMH